MIDCVYRSRRGRAGVALSCTSANAPVNPAHTRPRVAAPPNSSMFVLIECGAAHRLAADHGSPRPSVRPGSVGPRRARRSRWRAGCASAALGARVRLRRLTEQVPSRAGRAAGRGPEALGSRPASDPPSRSGSPPVAAGPSAARATVAFSHLSDSDRSASRPGRSPAAGAGTVTPQPSERGHSARRFSCACAVCRASPMPRAF